jgi:hypothetical protein
MLPPCNLVPYLSYTLEATRTGVLDGLLCRPISFGDTTCDSPVKNRASNGDWTPFGASRSLLGRLAPGTVTTLGSRPLICSTEPRSLQPASAVECPNYLIDSSVLVFARDQGLNCPFKQCTHQPQSQSQRHGSMGIAICSSSKEIRI